MNQHGLASLSRGARVLGAFGFVLFILYSLFITFSSYLSGDQEAFLFFPSQVNPGLSYEGRVAVREHSGNRPIENASVSLVLQTKFKKKIASAEGRTDSRGLATMTFTVPQDVAENELTFAAVIRSPQGTSSFHKEIPVTVPVAVEVFTDKDSYRPGERIFIQAALHDSSTWKPLASRPAEITVLNPKGTRVALIKRVASQCGIVHCVFTLADSTIMGTYTIKVSAQPAEGVASVIVGSFPECATMATITTDRPFYLPGEQVKGVVEVTTAPGIPEGGRDVVLKCGMESEKTHIPLSELQGVTGSSGSFPFSITLPKRIAPEGLGSAMGALVLSCSFTDPQGRRGSVQRRIPLGEKPCAVTFIPESGFLVPGLRNRLFIVCYSPDGAPVKARLTVKLAHGTERLTTDSSGIAVISYDPIEEAGTITEVRVEDSRGTTIEVPFDSSSPAASHTFTLSPDRVVLRAGEKVPVHVQALDKEGTIFLDLTSGGNLERSATMWVKNGKASCDLAIPHHLRGIATIEATRIDSEGAIEKAGQTIFIVPSQPLRVDLEPDTESSYPGERASVKVRLSTREGRPLYGALTMLLKNQRDGRPSALPFRIPQSFGPMALADEVAQATAQGTGALSSESLQKKARVVFSLCTTQDNGIQRENLLQNTLRSNYDRKIRYFSVLFTAVVRLMLIFLVACTLAILVLTYLHGLDKAKGTGQCLVLRENYEITGIIIFIVGFYLLLLAPALFASALLFFSGTDFVSLHRNSLFQLFMAMEIFLMFIYLMTLKRDSRFESVRNLATLKHIVHLMEWYTGTLIISISLLFICSLRQWNAAAVLQDNAPFILCALLTIFAMPFLLLFTTLSHLARPRKSRARSLAWHGSALIVIGAAFAALYLIFAHSDSIVKGHRASLAMAGKAMKPSGQGEEGRKTPEAMKTAEPPETVTPCGITFACSPEVPTDRYGNANFSFFLPEAPGNLTIQARGYTRQGQQGSASREIALTREFFIDAPVPPFLTCGDRISLPVTFTNCTTRPLRLFLELAAGGGLELTGTLPYKTVLDGGEKRQIMMEFLAARQGQQSFSLTARSGSSAQTLRKTIEVLNPGAREYLTRSGWLKGDLHATLEIPDKAMAHTMQGSLSIFPGNRALIERASMVLGSLPSESCDEVRASASTRYLLLRHLARIGEKQDRTLCDDELSVGYQKLLTFEREGGGFALFRESPPSVWLSAQILSDLVDISEFHAIDDELRERTCRWLISSQKPDGSWENNPSTSALVIMALAKAGKGKHGKVQRGLRHLKADLRKNADPLTLALFAMALTAAEGTLPVDIAERLYRQAQRSGNACYWSTSIGTLSTLPGIHADIETTALCTRVLMAQGTHPESSAGALAFLAQARDPEGTWHSASATVEALKTFLAGEPSGRAGTRVKASVLFNGHILKNMAMTSQAGGGSEEILDFSEGILYGKNDLHVIARNTGGALYEVSASYSRDAGNKSPAGLKLSLRADKGLVSPGSSVEEKITLSNRGKSDIPLVVIRLPIPPGFSLLPSGVEQMKRTGKIEASVATPGYLYLYISAIKKGTSLTFPLSLKALYPVEITTQAAYAYEYKDPWRGASAPGIRLTVR
ncbi:MAG: MG2 domain-containing protein [Candidatus Eremiobacteraeota bacterium]|nr:MG2 domain-containing protein [Candidatus Eremiobacteraeota bacterium]